MSDAEHGAFSTDDLYSKESEKEIIELPSGKTGVIHVLPATLDEIERFGERESSGESMTKVAQDVFDDYLEEPANVDASKIPLPKLNALLEGIFRAWGVEEGEIDELMEERQGN